MPSIILIATLSFVFHLIFSNTFDTAINSFISCLVVACPCALGLATPLAIVISEGNLAKLGILVKKSETLENAGKIDTVVFDKTGTLTYGNLKISKVLNYNNDSLLMTKVSSIESMSNHPISRAFNEFKKENKLETFEVSNFEELAGFGL